MKSVLLSLVVALVLVMPASAFAAKEGASNEPSTYDKNVFAEAAALGKTIVITDKNELRKIAKAEGSEKVPIKIEYEIGQAAEESEIAPTSSGVVSPMGGVYTHLHSQKCSGPRNRLV